MDKEEPKARARRGKPVQKACAQCGSQYKVRSSRADTSWYCSHACKSLSQRSLPDLTERPCKWCGIKFTPPKRRRRPMIFCSPLCSARHLAATPYTEDWYVKVRAAAVVSGDRQRGSGAGKTYRKRGGRHEHRAVAEEKAGRRLTFQDVVHHIDGDILNNSPDNLEITTRAEHMKMHGLGVPGQPPLWYTRNRQKEEK